MDIVNFINSDVYTLIVIPFLIFIARIIDVSIGTIRVIFVSKGYKFVAPILGFFEILIWLSAMRQILMNLTNIYCYIAYAGGFAAGTFIGIHLEEKISIGKVVIRIITRKDITQLVDALKLVKYNLTIIDGNGTYGGQVKIIFSVIKRHDIKNMVRIIKKFNPNAFYSIEDVRYVSEDKVNIQKNYMWIFGKYRKSK